MKNSKFLKVFFLIFILFPGNVFAYDQVTNYGNNNYYVRSYEYYIKNYDINVVVNENNTFDITENITAFYNLPKHGIFRTIPLKNTVTRLDGSISKNRALVSNVFVSDEYTTYRQNEDYVIKIGSIDEELTGEKNYVIKYTYDIGNDPVKKMDELYYNLIGTEWDTVIGGVTFTITLPKEFDSSKLGFSSGEVGSLDNSKVEYTVSGNVIKGSYSGFLKEGEALTVRCQLPDGYFVRKIDKTIWFMLLVPLIGLITSIFLWYFYGRDEKVVETVEFYPPEGFNSLEVGFLYKGSVNNQDVVSLLIYLANKGYIKISEFEEKSLFSKSKGFKLTKLKEYDGNNINERLFLNGLFTKKASFAELFSKTDDFIDDNIYEVTSGDLYNSFYKVMGKIFINMGNKENRRKIFKKATWQTIVIIFMLILANCFITIPPVFLYGQIGFILPALIFTGIGFPFMFSMLVGDSKTVYVNGRAVNSLFVTKLFGLLLGGMFWGVPWAFMVLPALIHDFSYLISYFIGFGCIFGMFLCFKYLPKRTPYGNEILGKLKGFRNFLMTAEKDRLEAMVMQNPTYFYDILPYTYVLGVSDKWIKKFETIALQAPTWYDSPTGFSTTSFGSFIDTTMTSAQSVMSSSPSSSSSSGGGFSGGGSSGGGSGGGGGGSW